MRDETRADVHDEPGSEFLDEVTLRALIEHVPATVYIDRLDETGSNVYTSPRLEAELGYTVQEWVSDKELYAKVLHPEDRERILAEYRRTRDTDEPFRAEYRMIARDGTVHWYLDEAAVIRDEAGRPAGLLPRLPPRHHGAEAGRGGAAGLRGAVPGGDRRRHGRDRLGQRRRTGALVEQGRRAHVRLAGGRDRGPAADGDHARAAARPPRAGPGARPPDRPLEAGRQRRRAGRAPQGREGVPHRAVDRRLGLERQACVLWRDPRHHRAETAGRRTPQQRGGAPAAEAVLRVAGGDQPDRHRHRRPGRQRHLLEPGGRGAVRLLKGRGDRTQPRRPGRSEEHTSELQSPYDLVCRLLLEKKKKN